MTSNIIRSIFRSVSKGPCDTLILKQKQCKLESIKQCFPVSKTSFSSIGTPEMSTPILDDLLSLNPLMRVKDKTKVEDMLNAIVSGGKDKLQLIIDFDHTLTKTRNEKGERVDCSWGVMENSALLPDSYTKECNKLREKYLPIELDPKMSVEEKIPFMIKWYEEANRFLLQSKVQKSFFAEMVQTSNVELRDQSNEMLDHLSDANIPVLILSAGLGDLINEILNQRKALHPNLKVVSNFLSFGEDGTAVGFDSEIIHVYNKNENAIHDSEYFKVLEARKNVILLGDSVGDLQMADGINNPEAVLKIGFLNSHVDELLDKYMDLYDIVLADDQSMALPYCIIKKIQA